MRTEARWTIAIVAALALGALAAPAYARLAAPYYTAVARLLATGQPWQIADVEVREGPGTSGTQLQLHGVVHGPGRASAFVVGKVQVGAAIETPLVFWTLLMTARAGSARTAARRIAAGLPVYAVLEAATTAVALMHAMPEASAVLAGAGEVTTGWERWTDFLEGGGRFALAAAAALATLAVSAPRARA